MTSIDRHLKIENIGPITILRFACDLDAANVNELRGYIDDQISIQDYRSFVVDLQEVPFLDSHGVGLFTILLRRAHERHGVLAFSGADGQPKSVLRMVGFDDQLVKYYDRVDMAVAELGRST